MKFLFILFTLFSLSVSAQTTSKTLGGNYPSGFSGFRNYIKNPGGEIDAQNVSVAGTNGTIGVFSNNPITNKKSFRVGGNLNTNITATFTADAFDQGLADSSNACAAALNLQPNGTGTYTINVKLGSTTVATKSFTTASAIPVQYHTFLYSCGTLAQVPTIDVVANLTSGSGTDHFQADDIYMGQDPGFIASMAVRTQEQNYTPTYTGFGTVSTSNMKWYQDGAYIYVYGNFVSGTSTGVEARMSLPTGYTSSATISTIMLCGDAGINASSTTYFRNGVLCETNVAYVTFGAQNSTTNVVTKALGTGLTANGQLFYVNAKIPISGASNIQAIASQCLQDGSCLNEFSAQVSAAGVVSNENVNWINGNCVVTGTSVFTCTYPTSFVSAAMNCTATVSDSAGAQTARMVSSSTSTVVVKTYSYTSNADGAYAFSLHCSRGGTDVKPVMQAPWVSGSLTTDATGPYQLESASISSTGVISGSYIAWLTSSCSVAATNQYTCTFATTKSAAPDCWSICTAGTCTMTQNQSTSTSTVVMYTFSNAGAAVAASWKLFCKMPR